MSSLGARAVLACDNCAAPKAPAEEYPLVRRGEPAGPSLAELPSATQPPPLGVPAPPFPPDLAGFCCHRSRCVEADRRPAEFAHYGSFNKSACGHTCDW